MQIDVCISAGHVLPEQTEGKLVVVIDVLRATSVICTALANGAKSIMAVQTIDQALALKENGFLIGGERDGLKLEGFDFGNSPLEYTAKMVNGKTIALTTSNGTRAIESSKNANEIIIASFLNISAVVDYLKNSNMDICIVCAGTLNKFSLDDALCAGKIISLLSSSSTLSLTDSAFAHLMLFSHSSPSLASTLAEGCNHYNYVKQIGFEADLDFCLQEDIFTFVPKLNNNEITINYDN